MKFLLVVALTVCMLSFEASADFSSDYVSLILSQGAMTNERTQDSIRLAASAPLPPFNCKVGPLTTARPTSVHTLRPSDIDVIGAIGDSLTAANGAKASTILGLLEECRGQAWSIGGENPDSKTLANILRKFNPNLYGFSLGSGKNTSANAVFNAANAGHTSFDMPNQAYDLVQTMKRSNKIDFQNSWKLVTLFIGGNDLCKSCDEKNKYTINNYVQNVQKALDYFRDNLPRAFINVVLSLDVTGIDSLTGTTCRNMQKTFCKCNFDESYRPTLNGLVKGFQRGVEDLVSTGRYDTKPDFTVVTQPFMTQMKPPTLPNGTPDYTLFSPDCFHFSSKGHQAGGIEAWNSLLTPVGQKSTKWNEENNSILCPTAERPYLFTSKNSNARPSLLQSLIKGN